MKRISVPESELLSVSQAARLKGVAATTIYRAVNQGRLPHVRVLGHVGVRKADLLAWTPVAYGGRSGAKGRGGRPCGTPMSEEAKARISSAQKESWRQRKAKVS